MKVLSPFLAGFALAMAMDAITYNEIVLWISLFSLGIVVTIAFDCLEKL